MAVSALSNSVENASNSTIKPSLSDVSMLARIVALATFIVAADLLPMVRASASVRSIRSSAGTTWFTKPMRWASVASIISPVNTSSMARPRPTKRAKRWVPPPPGISPRLISGVPKLERSLATRRSQATATSHPPPSAKPSIMAMVGLLMPQMASHPLSAKMG